MNTLDDDQSVAQDPRELFDIVTSEGVPLGFAKQRGAVHRDGDWHRSVHVWVVGVHDERPFITFQRRSLAKDTWPGRLDATVGGHYRAGESIEQTLREVEEEIGIRVSLNDLRYVGQRVSVNEAEAGVIDRELQDVYFLRDDRDLTVFAPNPAELAALVRFPLAGALDFLGGAVEHLEGEAIAPGEMATHRVRVTPDAFIIRADRYFYRVAIAAERFLAGERHIAV